MARPVPTDVEAYRRLRRTARWVTVGFVLVTAYLVVVMIRAKLLGLSLAIVPYLMLCAVCAAGFWVLRALWRRVRAARPVFLADDAGPGARIGLPELDDEPGPHLGLTGEVDPPTRW